MRNYNKVKINIMLSLVVLIFMTSCSPNPQDNTNSQTDMFITSGQDQMKESDTEKGIVDLKDYKLAEETDALALYYNTDNSSIIVEDKRTDSYWTSAVDYNKSDITAKLNQFWRYNLSSIVYLHCYDLDNNQGVDITTTPIEQEVYFNIAEIKQGFKVDFNFNQMEIRFSVEFRIKEDKLIVTIPFSSIKEGKKYGITAITLLPVFGACNTDTDGYAFYPDGSGAISNFSSKKSKSLTTDYSWTIYGTDRVDIDQYNYEENADTKNAMMPIFGMKEENSAFLGIINKGEADATIKYSPGGSVVDLNYINATFIYRRVIDLTDLGGNGINQDQDEIISKFDMKLQKKDAEITYIFLENHEADYSGMANAYRAYLLENNKLNTSNSNYDSIPLYLNIFMGVCEDRVLIDKYITMTDFDQAIDILKELDSSGLDNCIIGLSGWSKNGYREYYTPFITENKLGGENGLNILSQYTRSKKFELYLNNNFIKLGTNKMFSDRGRLVFSGASIPVTDQNNTLYLINMNYLFNKFIPNYLKLAQRYQVGLTLEGLGKRVYDDHNSKHPFSRQQSVDYIVDNLKKITTGGQKISLEGNAYTLASSNLIRNLSDDDSGYDITTKPVPFYQMVVHGYIPYYSTPGNLSSDFAAQKLKWVEYGYLPSFEVSNKSAEMIKYTDYNKLFSSQFSYLKNTIEETVKDMNSRLGNIQNAKMIYHTQLQEGVYEIKYDNGTTVYVNYNNYPVSIGDISIKALDYTVKKV